MDDDNTGQGVESVTLEPVKLRLPRFRTFTVSRYTDPFSAEIEKTHIEAHNCKVNKSGVLEFYDLAIAGQGANASYIQYMRHAFKEWLQVQEEFIDVLRVMH